MVGDDGPDVFVTISDICRLRLSPVLFDGVRRFHDAVKKSPPRRMIATVGQEGSDFAGKAPF
jgi:hypothetical protein